MADVFKQYVEGLEELDADVAAGLLTQDVQEEDKHVLLQKKADDVHMCRETKILAYDKLIHKSVRSNN